MVATAPVSQPARLRAIFDETGDLRGSFRWFLGGRSNDFVASLYFWLNLLFLADHVAATVVGRNLRRHRDTLAQMFLQIGSLDADIAIASWLERIPAHCAPDEIFRGTNTPERVAAGKAVLESLDAHAQVLVTTHDVELQHLLGPSFLTFHFVEDPELAEVFDYRLHPGISTTRNAIKLLAKIGFPPAIVREARRIADAFTAR